MKNKRRLFTIFTIILIFSALIRLGNVFLLILGDYSKKNVYALSHTGACVWEMMGDVADYGASREGKTVVQFGREFEISRESGGMWDILGMFGVHNVQEKEKTIIFDVSSFNCYLDIIDKSIDVCRDGSYNTIFVIEDGEIAVTQETDEAIVEKYADKVDEIIQKSDEILKKYKMAMDKFTILAVIFESVLLVIHAMVIAFLFVSNRRIAEKMASEDQSSNLAKRCNLKWGLVEMLVYSFIVEVVISIIMSNGYYLDFVVFNVIFWTPIYIITMIVSFVIYFIKKKKLKKEVVQICIEE